MARFNGTDLIIKVNDTAIAHTTSASLSLEMASVDVSSKDSSGNQEIIEGQKSHSIDFEGLTDFSPSSGYGITTLYDLFASRGDVTWFFGIDGGDNFTGSGYITSLSIDAPMEDASTFSGTITVTGAVTRA